MKAIRAPRGSAREAMNDAFIPFLIDPVDFAMGIHIHIPSGIL